MAEREGQSKHIEREFEIGKDESWFANVKRLFDEMLDNSLVGSRQNRVHFDKLISDAQQMDNARQGLANLALANAVGTADMVSKQAVRHSDLAIDRQWNVDEVSTLVAKTGVQSDLAIALAIIETAKAVNKDD